MADRKVINKYYPPDFDPSKISRRRKPNGKNDENAIKRITVRLMTPFSMRCKSCGEYIAKGKKFNARKENTGDKYLGLSIFRFFIRCPRCSSELTFKTDPKNADYVAEKGVMRNFEPGKSADDETLKETEEERLDRLEKEEREAEEAENEEGNRGMKNLNSRDTMEKLEAKNIDADRQLAMENSIDEIRMLNARRERTLANDDILTQYKKSREEKEALELAKYAAEEEAKYAEEDDKLAKAVFQSNDENLESLSTKYSLNSVFRPKPSKIAKKKKKNPLGVIIKK